MTKFDEALDHLQAATYRWGRQHGNGVVRVPSEVIAAEADLRAIHEADRALAKKLAEALVDNDPWDGCDSLQYEELHCSSSPCKEKFMRAEALADAKAAGVIE